jgi:hypothetical protein
MKFEINTADKPKLEALMKSNPAKAKEVIGTFVSLIEESLDESNAIPWVDLPEKFGGGLTFPQLIKGILHGALDLQNINPELYSVLKEEVHPLSMLTARKDALTGQTRYHDWRNHFRLEPGTKVDQEMIETIFRKLLRYYKYIDMDDLAGAIMYNQIATFKGVGDHNVKALPFYPALRYQKETLGELHVGRFIDSIGSLDCGNWDSQYSGCPACQREEIKEVGKHVICLSCNAGFEKAE